MSLIKQLIPGGLKFTPTSDINWTRIETLVHGPGASDIINAAKDGDRNSAVFACLMTIASAYPEPPLRVFRRVLDGDDEEIPDHPMKALLDEPTPNGELNLEELLFWVAWAKHTDGNAYLLKVRSGNSKSGNVVELWPVSPSLMRPVTLVNERGRAKDWISHYSMQVAPNQFEEVPVENVVHLRLGVDPNDLRLGLSPLKRLIRQIGTDDEADRFTEALLKNYAVPGLVVVPGTDGDYIDPDAAEKMEAKLGTKFGADNRGKAMVISRKASIAALGFSPKDMEINVLHRIPEERIAAVIGVPAIVAGLGAGLDRATYANFRESREMFTEQKLVPLWRQDAARLTTSLRPDFTDDDSIALRFDLTDVRALQQDENAKYQRLQLGVSGGWVLRNEARADVGLPPIDGWDDEDTAPPEPVPAPLAQVAQGPRTVEEEEEFEGDKALRWREWKAASPPDEAERTRFEDKWKRLLRPYLAAQFERIAEGMGADNGSSAD